MIALSNFSALRAAASLDCDREARGGKNAEEEGGSPQAHAKPVFAVDRKEVK